METNSSFSCALTILVRNEIIGCRTLFDKIPWNGFEQAYIIDGHSTDGTREFFEERSIPVFLQPTPGYGAAMMEARARCRTTALVFYHPDGNEDPADLLPIRSLLAAGRDFVVASRMIPGAFNEEDTNLIRPRKWANQGLALIANILWGSRNNRTTDITNGMRGMTCAAWDALELDSRDLTMDFQMVIRALKRGVTITEVPTREGKRIGGATNFASFSTGVAELKLILRELRCRTR